MTALYEIQSSVTFQYRRRLCITTVPSFTVTLEKQWVRDYKKLISMFVNEIFLRHTTAEPSAVI
jgi:hypothetical protein